MSRSWIGIHNGSYCLKNAKKQELGIDEQILKDSLIRSLYREQEKFVKACDVEYLNRLKSKIARLKRELRSSHNKNTIYSNGIFEICEKYNLNYREVIKLIRNN